MALLLRLARNAGHRTAEQKLLLSGHKIVTEYLEAKQVLDLFVTPRYARKYCHIQGTKIAEHDLERITREARPEGILAVIRMPSVKQAVTSRLLLLQRLRDPRNLGAMLRSAHALGFKVKLLDCCDAYSLEAIRVARGVHLIWDDVLIDTPVEQYQVIASELPDKLKIEKFPPDGFYFSNTVQPPFALLMGEETHGLAASTITPDAYASIRATGSLNVSIAASILMQRLMINS